MKTLNEIRKHCVDCGYTNEAMLKICGFLIAKEIKGERDVIKYKEGYHNFDFFLQWFNDDEFYFEDMERGQCIHIKDGLDVMLLSPCCNNSFVGVTGEGQVSTYLIEDGSRPCTKQESKNLEARLREKGLKFNNDTEELKPYLDEENPIEKKLIKLEELCGDVESGKGSIVLEEIYESLTNILLCLSAEMVDEDAAILCASILEDLAMFAADLHNDEK